MGLVNHGIPNVPPVGADMPPRETFELRDRTTRNLYAMKMAWAQNDWIALINLGPDSVVAMTNEYARN